MAGGAQHRMSRRYRVSVTLLRCGGRSGSKPRARETAEIVLPALKGEPHARARAVVEDRLDRIPRRYATEIATALGIGVAMLLMSALMGLVFLSSGTGHDDSIVDPLEDERQG